jgi:hypothetical protein
MLAGDQHPGNSRTRGIKGLEKCAKMTKMGTSLIKQHMLDKGLLAGARNTRQKMRQNDQNGNRDV